MESSAVRAPAILDWLCEVVEMDRLCKSSLTNFRDEFF